jgi:nucleotide-binding universal stress UspA family protein
VEHTYHIVVGVDGSDGSLRALRWAAREAQTRGGAVAAVMTYDWAGNEAALLAGLGPEAERQRAEDVLSEAVAGVARDCPGVSITAEVLMGRAAQQLAIAARDADLLVVGSHGHGRLRHAVLGSVSEACVRLATCPVVVVPTPEPAAPHPTDVDVTRADGS